MSRAQSSSYDAKERRFPMSLLLAAGLILFVLWASVFELDEAVRTTGQIIPNERTQIVQSVDGGVVSEILVQEGQFVKAGQKLAVLERGRANAGYEESKARRAALRAALTRARAEAVSGPLIFEESVKEYPEFVDSQRRLFEQRKIALDDSISTLEQALEMSVEELRMTEALLKDGDVSKLDLLRAQRAVLELEGKLTEIKNKSVQEARAEVAKLEEELSSTAYKIDERQDILRHTDLKAPLDGVVKFLRINTVGGVLRPGDELMQIAPSDGGVMIEAKVDPTKVGSLKLDLPAIVRIDAFDYSIYGSLVGKLTLISPDTLTDTAPNGQSMSYFRIHVLLDADQSQNPKSSQIIVKPGMTATVDIMTGKRSVLRYLLKPIVRAFSGAMQEK
ncbi:HlyD family efflux transporter periplasmic adaptor subunit [Aureimonas fodinaquatilis]|uniref:HlyD family efflux transporter periplasmic adaptor subunit n=1 Tax=Aureimonas fodinaquatilis TaxID=2565783 RepID=A0A5B0DNH6_9HYPH|nr:HlyD family efflux transporter periplasmic adaptor subunit [Aureimonas fodinaquatilis]KAA0968437.1 HlyD family efflux transporter periplasmic adaptor subunit [Aureimonas fodinaquatilis]